MKDLHPDVKHLNPDEKDLNPNVKYLNPDVKDLSADVKDVNPDVKDLNPDVKDLNPDVKDLDTPRGAPGAYFKHGEQFLGVSGQVSGHISGGGSAKIAPPAGLGRKCDF